MATVRIFLSFEFDKDKQLYRNFYAQAQENSSYRVTDHSLRQDYPTEEWLDKAREKIRQCDLVIVLVGQDTHNAPGVEKEVTVANQLDKPIFQIRPQGKTWGKVSGAGELRAWKWKNIDEMIDTLL